MVTTCYSCRKEIGMFGHRGTTMDILRAGFTPPDGMSKHDRLCQECLDQFKTTQVRGQKLNERVNLAGQIILCIIFPLVAFYRIRRTIDFIFYKIIIVAIGLAVAFIPLAIDKNNPIGMWFLGGGLLFAYVGGWIIPIHWIIEWTNEYNKNSI